MNQVATEAIRQDVAFVIEADLPDPLLQRYSLLEPILYVFVSYLASSIVKPPGRLAACNQKCFRPAC